TGETYSCSALDDGRIMCWGNGASGQLGRGSTASSNLPVQVSLPDGAQAVQVELAKNHACAILTDGDLMCWGENGQGQLGIGSTVDSHVPVSVNLPDGVRVTDVSLAERHGCLLLDNGSVMCWGYGYGVIGDGWYTDLDEPTYVDTPEDRYAIDVAVGSGHSCVVLDNGSAMCWGQAAHGKLGISSFSQYNDRHYSQVPEAPPTYVSLPADRQAVAITSGCVILADGDLMCWGEGDDRLGDGSGNQAACAIGTPEQRACSWAPVFVDNSQLSGMISSGGATVIPGASDDIAAGGAHSCALNEKGAVLCWGAGDLGQLGDGLGQDSLYPVYASLPVGRHATMVTAGSDHSCVLLDNGSVACWGAGTSGQLGNGFSLDSSTPVLVSLPEGRQATTVAAGDAHTCAVLDDYSAVCWGEGGFGRLGGLTSSDSNIPMTISQPGLDYSTSAVRELTVVVPDISSAGSSGGLRIQIYDVVTNAWVEVINDGADLSTDSSKVYTFTGRQPSKIKLFAKNSDALLLTTVTIDGIQYGDDSLKPISTDVNDWLAEYGGSLREIQLGATSPVGTWAPGVTALSAGARHSCAILTNGTSYCWGYGLNGALGNSEERSSEVPLEVSLPLDPLSAMPRTTSVADGTLRFSYNSRTVYQEVSVSDLDEITRFDVEVVASKFYSNDNIYIEAQFKNSVGVVVDTQRSPSSGWTSVGACCTTLSVSLSDTFASWSDITTIRVSIVGDDSEYWPGNYGPEVQRVDLIKTTASGTEQLLVNNDFGEGTNGWTSEAGWQTCSGSSGSKPCVETSMIVVSVDSGLSAGSTNIISSGDSHTCAVLDDGSVRCWGENDHGQLGDGTSSSSSTPVSVALPVDSIAISVASGKEHTCALLSTGEVLCWGAGSYGRLGNDESADSAFPVLVSTPDDSVAIAIAAGDFHTCLILDDDSVKCWGRGLLGRLGLGDTANSDVPRSVSVPAAELVREAGPIEADLSQSFTLDAWLRHDGDIGPRPVNYDRAVSKDGGCRIDELGYVACDGTFPYFSSELDAPQEPIFAIARSASSYHTCIIDAVRDLYCWGEGNYGQVGDGAFSDRQTPVRIELSGQQVVDVDTNQANTCVILANDSVQCWGRNHRNQVSLTLPSNGISTPVEVPVIGTSAPVEVHAGAQTSCARFEDGSVECWGEKSFVGDSNTLSTNGHVQLDFGAGRTATDIDLKQNTGCAVLDDGTVKCWGQNTNQQAQGSGGGQVRVPANPHDLGVELNGDVIQVVTDSDHSCAMDSSGAVACWGKKYNANNQQAQLLDASRYPDGMPDFVRLFSASYGVDTSGNVWLLAFRSSSQPTSPVTSGAMVAQHDRQVVLDTDILTVSLSSSGLDSTSPAYVTVEVKEPIRTVKIVAGDTSYCALASDGTIRCWGDNRYGQLGTGDQTDIGHKSADTGNNLAALDFGASARATDVAFGDAHGCALFEDGTVRCWGANGHGQLGIGSTTPHYLPAPPVDLGTHPDGGPYTATAITAGSYHTCALLSDGKIKCWGHNSYGQLGQGHSDTIGNEAGEMGDSLPVIDTGGGTGGAISLGLGTYTTCAVFADGRIS
ncbi:MAG TPA: hypothetical protein QF646_01445, partial [Candidatus Poseidoniales archaeon]|nr:hypothetical protein [Candidatus Poseidoniales archaeon]